MFSFLNSREIVNTGKKWLRPSQGSRVVFARTILIKIFGMYLCDFLWMVLVLKTDFLHQLYGNCLIKLETHET